MSLIETFTDALSVGTQDNQNNLGSFLVAAGATALLMSADFTTFGSLSIGYAIWDYMADGELGVLGKLATAYGGWEIADGFVDMMLGTGDSWIGGAFSGAASLGMVAMAYMGYQAISGTMGFLGLTSENDNQGPRPSQGLTK